MNNEYKPLHELILEVLEEGTVLENIGLRGTTFRWDGFNLFAGNGFEYKNNPFITTWRRISTPPKKIEFETTVKLDDDGDCCLYLPDDHKLEDGTHVRVTVEEKR